jgi:hypothetical protein
VWTGLHFEISASRERGLLCCPFPWCPRSTSLTRAHVCAAPLGHGMARRHTLIGACLPPPSFRFRTAMHPTLHPHPTPALPTP